MDYSKMELDKQPLDPAKLNITTRSLHQPPLDELMNVLAGGLTTNFAEASIELADCPDLGGWLYRPGLCGSPIILEVGGPAYLLPTVQKDKFYDIKLLLRHLNYNHNSLVIGAGAGPWPLTGSNCELIMKVNITVDNKVEPMYNGVANGTHYAFVKKSDGKCKLVRVLANEDETTFALLANLYVCEGNSGKVIRVRAKKRTGKLDFIACMQKALENHYKDKLVGLGGMFEMKNGKVKQHIMPDFSETPLNTEAQLNNWLRFYDMETPLVAVGTFVSTETDDLDLRVQHFHSASHENELGGHYHIDTTPDTIEYEGYFNVAETLYRIDQPSNKLQFGKD